MRLVSTVIALSFFLPHYLFAADTDPSVCIDKLPASFTCYGPGKDPIIEGPFATSKPGLNGQAIPITLDDVRKAADGGRSIPVTLAANPMHYGKYYNIGTIVYTSAIDGATYKMENVMGYVHDTGSAFREGSCKKYGTCTDIYRKLDIAHGDYRFTYTRGGLFDLNRGPSCAKINKTVCQIAGPLTTPPQVTNQGVQPGNDQMMSYANSPVGRNQTTGVNAPPGVTASPYARGASQATSQNASTKNAGAQTGISGQTNTQSGVQSASPPTVITLSIPPKGFVLKRFARVPVGGTEWISWGVVGSTTSCSVNVTSPTDTLTVGQGRSGTVKFDIPENAPKGTWNIAFTCSEFNALDSFIVI